MTVRKSDIQPRGDRPPAYVDRVTGATELRISPETWDQWVANGTLPPPAPGFPEGSPRWRWDDVDRKLAGKPLQNGNAFVAAVGRLGHGAQKGGRDHAA